MDIGYVQESFKFTSSTYDVLLNLYDVYHLLSVDNYEQQ